MSLFSISLDLYKLALTQDASNAAVRTLGSSTATGLLCSVQPLRGYEIDNYQRRGITVDFQIFTDYDFDTNLSGGLKLGYLLKDPASAFQYQVKGVEKSANLLIRATPLYRILCRRIVV